MSNRDKSFAAHAVSFYRAELGQEVSNADPSPQASLKSDMEHEHFSHAQANTNRGCLYCTIAVSPVGGLGGLVALSLPNLKAPMS